METTTNMAHLSLFLSFSQYIYTCMCVCLSIHTLHRDYRFYQIVSNLPGAIGSILISWLCVNCVPDCTHSLSLLVFAL